MSVFVSTPGWNGRVVGLDGTTQGFLTAYEAFVEARRGDPKCLCGKTPSTYFHENSRYPWCGALECGLKIQQQIRLERKDGA